MFFLLICPGLAVAYIPSYPLLLSHLARSQGRGGYRIEQKLSLKYGAEPILLTETWWIAPSGRKRLDVSVERAPDSAGADKKTKQTFLRFIYRAGKKNFKDINNRLQTRPIPRYHLERPFHLRSEDKLRKLFALYRVVPFSPPQREEGAGEDPFVRLRRKGGAVQYEIGQGSARIWLQQDEFVIRAWKWATGDTLTAEDYQLYPGGLFFPSQRVFKTGSTEVRIQVISVQSRRLSPAVFSKSRLIKNAPAPGFASPDQDRVQEFYEKFR